MKQQKGIATLLLTSIVLIAALIMALSSYKYIFYQIKRAKNEIESRQQHWLAEGGLECAWAQFRINNKIPETLTDCNSTPSLDLSLTSDSANSSQINVLSRYRYAELHKSIQMLAASPLQTSGSLYLNGDFSFWPAPGQHSEQGWLCSILHVGNRFAYNDEIKNEGLLTDTKPSANFDSTQNCASDYLTDANYQADGKNLNKDIIKGSAPDMFQQFFGVSKSQYARIKNNGQFTQIVMSNNSTRCGKQIANIISNEVNRIWVEGHCEIKDEDYSRLVKYSVNNAQSSEHDLAQNATLIVVHDGLLIINTSESEKKLFNGVFFQLLTNKKITASDWASFSANFPNVVPEEFKNNAASYINGAENFYAAGGLFFDVGSDQSVIFNGDGALKYNTDIIDKFTSNSQASATQAYWMKGSWYAK